MCSFWGCTGGKGATARVWRVPWALRAQRWPPHHVCLLVVKRKSITAQSCAVVAWHARALHSCKGQHTVQLGRLEQRATLLCVCQHLVVRVGRWSLREQRKVRQHRA